MNIRGHFYFLNQNTTHMKSAISFFFLLVPFFLFAQAPLAELSAKDGGGDVSEFVEIQVHVNMVGKKYIGYFGIGQRKYRDVKGADGKRFKFDSFAGIWSYMKKQGYEFVLEVPLNPNIKAKDHLGNYLWEMKK